MPSNFLHILYHLPKRKSSAKANDYFGYFKQPLRKLKISFL